MIEAPHPRRLLAGRLVLALLLAAHGAAHFIVVARTVRSIALDLPLQLLGGVVVSSSSAVAMLVAVALAVAGTGFVAAAFMVVGGEPKVGPLLMAVAAQSLALTVVGLWATAGGVLVNLAVLAVVAGAPRPANASRPAAF